MFSSAGVDLGRGQFGQGRVGSSVAVVGVYVDGDQSQRMNEKQDDERNETHNMSKPVNAPLGTNVQKNTYRYTHHNLQQ